MACRAIYPPKNPPLGSKALRSRVIVDPNKKPASLAGKLTLIAFLTALCEWILRDAIGTQ